jgi:hypothetical protein
MRFVSVKEISGLGKAAIGAILAFGSLLQVPQFSAIVFHLANLHPHIAVITGALTTLAALLANPQVQNILHLGPADKIAAKDVQLADGVLTAASATLTKGPESKV